MIAFPPRTGADLRAVFLDYGLDSAHAPSGPQADLLLSLLDLYAQRGLFPDGRLAPLCDVCPRREPCWRADPAARRADGEDGSICLPWSGASIARAG